MKTTPKDDRITTTVLYFHGVPVVFYHTTLC